MHYRVEIVAEVAPTGPDVPVKYRWHCTCRGLELGGVSVQPLLDACRAIKRTRLGHRDAHGPVDGTALLFWPGKDSFAARCGIEWGAAHRVSETRKHGPRFERWLPHPRQLERLSTLSPTSAHASKPKPGTREPAVMQPSD